MIECGVALGDMTSEMEENNYISEFVSGGLKTTLLNYVIL